ncbi:MAG: GTP cyclohydrolase [Acidobacteria bacterium]|jgi:GTP cyclohydrolase II|nr:GTP cyclohydrolase [Acidobacteriota bacterium]
MIIKLAEGSLKTKFGEYQEILFYDGQKESIALILGDVEGAEAVLCRVHSSCIAAHNFNSIECDCREQMEISQRLIEKQGSGVIVWLDQEGKANGHFALLKSKEHKNLGLPQEAAYEAVGFKKDGRDFTKAAEILNEIGVKSIRMLTNNSEKTETLSRHGVNVVGTKALTITPLENIELENLKI